MGKAYLEGTVAGLLEDRGLGAHHNSVYLNFSTTAVNMKVGGFARLEHLCHAVH